MSWQTYISAVTDPKSISIVGTIKSIADLQAHALEQGLHVQTMDIRGKTHNPENRRFAEELAAICQKSPLLDLPGPEKLLVSLRSNRTGDPIVKGSLTAEVVRTILASKCEWYQLLTGVASDLKRTGDTSHLIVSFGTGDCIRLCHSTR